MPLPVRVRTLAMALALTLVFVRAGTAQVSVLPVSDLRFGELMAGIPVRIAPNDASKRAELLITAQGRVTIVVSLPAQLSTPGGQTLPSSFAANDGQYQVGTGAVRNFDPRSPLTITVPASSGSVRIFVGGTASPTSLQAPGSYSANVSAQVTR